jgi:hypothetical protein
VAKPTGIPTPGTRARRPPRSRRKSRRLLALLLPPGAIVAVWLLSWATAAQMAATVAIVLAAAWLVGPRGPVAARAFGATLFSVDRSRPIKLKDIKGDGVDHVFLATELHARQRRCLIASTSLKQQTDAPVVRIAVQARQQQVNLTRAPSVITSPRRGD